MKKTNELRTDQIEVTVKGSLKTEHTFQTSTGVLGVLSLNSLITEGTFLDSDGLQIHFKKTSVMKAHYELKEGEANLGSAKPVKALSRSFSLDYQGSSYRLEPEKMLSRSWKLTDRGGGTICDLKPRGFLKRGALIQISSEVSLSLLVFAYCLVTKRWQEESSTS